MDKKDLQIMELMAQNCRIANTTIGQALNLSKDTIKYRINKLEETEYIKQYVLFIDARKLGYTRYHLLLKFDAGIDKKAVCNDIAQHKFVMWLNTFIGRFDMQIIVDARDGFHLNKIREELFELCEHKVKEYTILTHLSDLEFTQMNPILDLETDFQRKEDHSFSTSLTTKKFPVDETFDKYEPVESEIKILKMLADNPRASLVDIGRTLKIDRSTVKKRIQHLIKKGIIINFGAIPNLEKQEFVTYYLLVRMEQETPMHVMKKPFTRLQNIFYAGKMIGDYDMILYLNARNPDELNSSIELFKKEIEEYISHYDLLVQDGVPHWRQFTNGIYEDLLARK